MKNKFITILKNNLINTFKLRNTNKKKTLFISILVIYIFVSIFMMLNEFFSGVYETLVKANLSNIYLTIVFSITAIFSFFFTIFSAKNALFENKDNDLLLGLPLKKETILLSRLSIILIYNFILGLAVIIPGVYVYFLSNPFVVKTFIIIFLLTLFSSVVPTILSSLFGYLIAFITSKSKNKNIIEFISYSLFISLYMIVIYKGNNILGMFINNPNLLNMIIKYLFFPIYLINLSITKSNLIYIFLYVVFNICVVYLFVSLLNKVYYKIISSLKSEKTLSKFELTQLKSSSKMITLIKKEVKRYFSSAIYVFNTSFGVIVLLIASIASLFYSPKDILSIIGNDLTLSSFMLVFYLLLFVTNLSVTTNSSLSIERNNFWILKMLPITPKEVFTAKKSVNLILLLPIIIFSLIIFRISGYITINEMIFLLVISILFSVTIANFGLICNLLFPKFDAPNDTVIVKQSAASLMGIMIPLVFCIIYISFMSSINISENLILVITFIIFLVLMILTNFILNTWGINKYRNLN